MDRVPLEILFAQRMQDGRLAVIFNDSTRCVLTMNEVLSAGVFEADAEPMPIHTLVWASNTADRSKRL